MKGKQLSLAKVFFAAGILISILMNLVLCIGQEPAITEHSFPISITYAHNGQTVTIEDEFRCTYTGPGQSVDPRDRFYDGALGKASDEIFSGDYLIHTYEKGQLVIITNLFAGYLMGDPQYADHYTEYYTMTPYVAFFDNEWQGEHSSPEELAPYDIELIGWEYPEPIENELRFAGITPPTPENLLPSLAVALVVLVLCLIFVKKDEGTEYTGLDKVTKVLNLAIGLVVLPFLTIVCGLSDINGGGGFASYIHYFTPAVIVYGLAASLCLRRKGRGKTAMLVQFLGPAVYFLTLIFEILSIF